LICIEVLSPGDSLADLQERVDDYVGMGVENIWIMDPVKRMTWVGTAGGIEPVRQDAFSVPRTPIQVPLADLYAELDELAAGR
jgi:Uma2 family endonuclease